MNEAEKRMYGMSAEDIQEQYMNGLTAKLSGLEMVIAGILSDCQEELRFAGTGGSDERIRRNLNVAKFILFEMMDARREKEAA